MYMAVEGTTREGPLADTRALAVLTVAMLPESAQSLLPPRAHLQLAEGTSDTHGVPTLMIITN